jgi:2-polyprenyl-3-methyl-5-hydroxy-6-metoxy-1,4-benzoquinol methylase
MKAGRGKLLYRPDCQMCGGDNKKVLFSELFTDQVVWDFLCEYYEGGINKDCLAGGKYEIAQCRKCGFIWQVYILDDELMEKFYNSWISLDNSFNKKRHAEASLYSGYARQMQAIADLLSEKPSEKKLLDYGMGWGYWCFMAKAFGYNVYGFELSKERVDFARKNGIDVIDSLPEIGTNNWDYINTEQVFEHLPNPKETLDLLVGSLKNRGIIRISVPNGRGIERKITKTGWKPSKNAIHPLEHINCFTHKSLINFAESAGLQLIRQPFMLGHRYDIKSYIKGLLGRHYRQYFGTSLYFRK